MKIFIVHDALGNIKSFGIPNNKLDGLRLVPPPEALVTEVDAPEIQEIDVIDGQQFGQVVDIIERSRIDVTGEKRRLVPK